ncbi:MAG: hypothetical protein BWY52_00759 [Chloroflexi bacterium ADurb.Bin325]|nr:MAG: hypothetical protein BWY52_00759 [Chloroflexi bacterium ADurb.Bin325]
MKRRPLFALLFILIYFGSVPSVVAPERLAPARLAVVEPAAAPAEPAAPQPQAEQAAAPSERSGYIKGFYISYAALGNADFIAHAQDLLENTELNAIVMDFKSDRGLLTFPTQVPLAQEIGAGQAPVIQDPAAFLGWFKERGVHTVARIVIFKDTVLASAYPSLAIIDAATGNLWRDQEQQAWVDPNRQEVWDYNTALAVEAARLGFDEVQFDYVRFPTDGNLHTALYALPNTYENRTAAISGLLRSTQAALAPYGVVFGVDVFGYTPWVNDDVGIGQEIETLAPYVDYLAPMVYPSTFANGLPGQNPKYANAIAYPYEIVHLSTIRAVARARAANPAVEIRPWLQDFGDYAFDWRDYTPGEIRAQMDGAREAGARGWYLWDPAVRYTREALVAAEPSFPPDRAGQVLVLAYRDFALPGEAASAGALTAGQLRADLEALLAAGFFPVNLRDLAPGKLSAVPAGKRAVVLTFDDSFAGQFRLLEGGRVDPQSAVGVLVAFNAEHPADWPLRATFFVRQEAGRPGDGLFGTNDVAALKLQLLRGWGMEVGVRPLADRPLREMTPEELQQALGQPAAQVAEWIGDDYAVTSLALPDGDFPRDRALLADGVYEGHSYGYAAAVGANQGLAVSPWVEGFDPYRIARVPASGEGLAAWLRQMEARGRFYVSAGE